MVRMGAYFGKGLGVLAGAALLVGEPAHAEGGLPALPNRTNAAMNHERARACLATAIAYEAGFEPRDGQEAVAEVILNRVRNPAFPKTVCDVVYQGSQRRTGCQFTFTCDGSLSRHLPDRVMLNARAVAESVLSGTVSSQVAGATHYHANYVSPYWAPSLIRLRQIGAHIFYRAPGSLDVTNSRAFSFLRDEPEIGQNMPARQVAAGSALPSPSAADTAAFAPWGLPTR